MGQFKTFNPLGAEPGKISSSPEELAYWKTKMPATLRREKYPHADSKRNYKTILDLSMISSLVLVIMVFMAMRNFTTGTTQYAPNIEQLVVEEIPITEQLRKQQAPPRPAVPIPSEEENIPDDITIDDTEIDFAEIPPPPDEPLLDDRNIIFMVYDTPPSPIGGYEAIYQNIIYPEIAKKASIEGVVYVKCLINRDGSVEKTEILKDSGALVGFEAAAMAALNQSKWEPAKQRDRAVRVWISVPIRFSLRSANG